MQLNNASLREGKIREGKKTAIMLEIHKGGSRYSRKLQIIMSIMHLVGVPGEGLYESGYVKNSQISVVLAAEHFFTARKFCLASSVLFLN